MLGTVVWQHRFGPADSVKRPCRANSGISAAAERCVRVAVAVGQGSGSAAWVLVLRAPAMVAGPPEMLIAPPSKSP